MAVTPSLAQGNVEITVPCAFDTRVPKKLFGYYTGRDRGSQGKRQTICLIQAFGAKFFAGVSYPFCVLPPITKELSSSHHGLLSM